MIKRNTVQGLDFTPLMFRAVDMARNRARFYTIRKGMNLLGQITVSSSYGRIGTHGQVKHAYFDTDAQADAYLAQVLRKRASAPKRIGCAYVRVVMLRGE